MLDFLILPLAHTAMAQDKHSAAKRQAVSRQSRTEAGGKQIAVMLDAEARVKLEAWVAKGFSIAQTVNRLLKRSRP